MAVTAMIDGKEVTYDTVDKTWKDEDGNMVVLAPDSCEAMLGRRMKDKVSGFVGTVTAFVTYLYDETAFQLTPETTDEKYQEEKWFCLPRLEMVAEK